MKSKKKRGKSFFLCLVMFMFFVANISFPVQAEKNSVVNKNGQLRVNGTQLCNKDNKPIQLKGMSYFWHCWDPGLYNENTVSELVNNWDATVVRVPMGIDVSGGYLSDPEGTVRKVSRVIDAAINEGVYVIIDWHEERATTHVSQSVNFFETMAKKYGNTPNIIYEIYNEPTSTSWSQIKDYAQQVISAIRKYDSDNIIIVGTPNWSQNVDNAADDPIGGNNIMYTLHFYAGTHKQDLRNKAQYALNKGLPIFATEWGTCDASGNGNLNLSESDTWLNFLDSNKISWCNWSLNTKSETASALRPNANLSGPWNDDELTESGIYVRSKLNPSIQTKPSTPSTPKVPDQKSGVVSGATYKIINVKSGKALDSAGTWNGANVQQWNYGGSNNQKWTITDVGEGKYKIESIASGLALDCAGSNEGANAQIWSYGGGNNQKWYFNDMGNGEYRLIGCESGKALDGAGDWDGANVQVWHYGGGDNQRWTLTRVD